MTPTPEPPTVRPPDTRRRLLVALLGVAALLAASLVALSAQPWATGPVTPPSTTPAPTPEPPVVTPAPATAPPATSAPAPQATSTRPAVPAGAVTTVWPPPDGPVRYADPAAAARGFALGLGGFTAPVLGPYRAGDSRSGEIEIRARTGSPVTTVLLRRLEDGTWWVLGSAADGVRLDTPAAGDVVSSPVSVTGEAVAFEGHVTVRILADGVTRPLATGAVTGGGDAPRPFAGTFPVDAPAGAHGSVVLTTENGRDGGVEGVTAVPVRFAG